MKAVRIKRTAELTETKVIIMSHSHMGLQKTHLLNTEDLNVRLQEIVHLVIEGYFSIDEQERNAYHVLLLIAEHWKKVNVDQFLTSTDYYTVLAKTTDLLLKGLAYNIGGSCQVVAGQLVIMNKLDGDSGIRATVYLMETDEQQVTNICNHIQKHLVKIGTTGIFYISIYSIVNGKIYKLYNKK